MPNKTIETVLKKHAPRLMSLGGVVGVGQGECAGMPCIIVMVEKLRHTLRERIPTQIEGFIVTIKETGKIDALSHESTH